MALINLSDFVVDIKVEFDDKPPWGAGPSPFGPSPFKPVEIIGIYDPVPQPAPAEPFTEQARALWEAIFTEPWPEGWMARWSDEMPAFYLGVTFDVSKSIVVNYRAHQPNPAWRALGFTPQDIIYTLIHEFLHVRGMFHRDHMETAVYDDTVAHLLGVAWEKMR